ncbi:uncharacterized protein LOC135093901 [Scylla paramamosain]|uniref:uncharacterized protein LOC135093901 n=1 Tax=Scylla paramamosain TaxID=85552 RepID=UPI003082C90E
MASVLPLLLLLLLLLVLGLGGAPRPTLALNCSVAVVEEGQTKPISIKPAKSQRIFGFMRPESDFKGVRLELQERNGTPRTAWFPASRECFPRNGMWLQLQTNIEPLTSGDFRLIFHTSACRKECLLQTTSSFHIISMAAAGPSSLYRSKDPPINCEWDLMPFSRHNNQSTRTPLSPCQDAPSNTTTTTTTTTSMKPTSTSTKTTSTASMKPTSTSTKTTTSREYSTTATTTTLLPLSVVMLVVFVLVFTVGYLAVFLVLAVRLRLHLATLTNEVMFLRGGLQSTSSREKTLLQAAASHSAARQGMESQAAQNFEEQTYDVLVL